MKAALRWDEGELYVDPVYLKVRAAGPDGGEPPASGPVLVNLTGAIDRKGELVELEDIEVDQGGVASLRGSGAMRLGSSPEIVRADLVLGRAPAGALFKRYVEPYLAASPLSGAKVRGHASGELRKNGRGLAVRVGLDNVALTDAEGRFGFEGVNGDLSWGDLSWASADAGGGSALRRSTLRFERGEAYGIALGKTAISAFLHGTRASLAAPVSLALLGGNVSLRKLEAAKSEAGWRWEFDGHVGPLSLQALSVALGWPRLEGAIEGKVPSVRYRDGVMTMDGALDVAAFDGKIRVRDLKLENPLGLASRLSMSADLERLSLEQLTGAFAFGSIEGRLSGEVKGLTLEQWQPVAFDARFYTPSGDESRHRISQRAVKNLASLGGVGAALSGTFANLFESFSYDRLGISCELRDGVCHMDGIEPADSGYYIVKGGGWIPRIDVVGFNRRVNWTDLIERLISATRSDGPIVK